MKHPFLFNLILLGFPGVILASPGRPEIEAAYLALSSQQAPFVEVTDEHLFSFAHDLDGDGREEVFITRQGLRDGKQGYL